GMESNLRHSPIFDYSQAGRMHAVLGERGSVLWHLGHFGERQSINRVAEKHVKRYSMRNGHEFTRAGPFCFHHSAARLASCLSRRKIMIERKRISGGRLAATATWLSSCPPQLSSVLSSATCWTAG